MYGLKRIIQIDTFIQSKRTVVETDGHSILDGTNGAGKSTTLRLIPFFYGIDPSQMDSHASGRDPFVQFYLPRQSSLIIFEYSREGGVCCAVVYRHKSGTKHAYRFLKSGFSEEAFSRKEAAGTRSYCKGHELKLHWKQLGLECSQQIEVVMDYRAIIQNDVSLINRHIDSRQLRSVAGQYCLGTRSTHMRHIERICSAIASRSGNLERMKDMIADIMADDGVTFPQSPFHPMDLALPSEIKSIRSFEQEIPRISQAISLSSERAGAIRLLRSLTLEVVRHKRNLGDDLKKNTAEEERLGSEMDNFKSKHNSTYQELSHKASDAESRMNSCQEHVEAVHAKFDEYEEQDMQQMASDYDNLQMFIDQLTDCEERYSLLIDDVKEEEGVVNKQLHDLQLRYERNRKGIQKTLDDLKDEGRKKELEHADQKNALMGRRSADKEKLRDNAAPQREWLRDARADARSLAKNGGFSQEERSQLAMAQSDIEAIDRRIKTLSAAEESKLGVVASAKLELDDGNSALDEAKRKVGRARDALDSLHKILFAEDGTWLRSLREDMPDWALTLGKVIIPELLQRKDFSPSFSPQDHQSIFGWDLNLSGIEVPEHAMSEDHLRARYSELEDAVSVAAAGVDSCSAACNKLLKKHQAASKAHASAAQELSSANAERRDAHEYLESLKRDVDAAVSARRAEAREEEKTLNAEIEVFDAQLKESISEVDAQYRQMESELHGAWSSENSRLTTESGMTKERLSELAASTKKREKELKDDFTKMCSNKGIDEETVRKASGEQNATKTRLDTIRDSARDVGAYRVWLETEWANLGKRTEELETLTAKHRKAITDINEEKITFGKKERALQKELGAVNREISDINDRLSVLRGFSPGIDGLIDNSGDCPEAGSELPFDLLVTRTTNALQGLEKTTNDLVARVQAIDIKIDGFGEAQIARAWERTKNEVAQHHNISDDERVARKFYLHLPDALSLFVSEEFNAIRQGRIESLRGAGMGLTEFFTSLADVHRGIKSQSGKISSSIKKNMNIDALSSISLDLFSRVDQLEYWKSLQEFSALWAEWRDSEGNELPSDALLDEMSSLITAMQSVKSGRHLRDYFDLYIRMTENGHERIIKSDNDMLSASSTGLMYLALCVIFVAMSRALCPDRSVNLHWPVDELGVLHSENLARLFQMLDHAGITMLGGFPSEDPVLLRHFKHQQVIDFKKGIRVISIPKLSFKDEALAQLEGEGA